MQKFIPTNDWQKVHEDAVLPLGCEIRMNMDTGESFARLPQTHRAYKTPKLPWWKLKTTRWGGSTTEAPFWRWVHIVNTFTRIRGAYWVWKERRA